MVLHILWKKLTQKALDKSSGELETSFFESAYRISYVLGLSLTETSISYKIFSNVIKLTIVLFVSSELWYLFSMSSSLDAVIDNINVTIIHLIVMYRYKSMSDSRKIYKKLAGSMESPYFDISTQRRKKILKYWEKMNEKYFKLLLTLANCTLAVWYVYPLMDDIEYNLVVALRLPFKYDSPERYPLTYALVLLAFHFISFFVVANDLMMQTYMMHVICQFAVLSAGFEDVLGDCSLEFKDLHEKDMVLNETFQNKYKARLGELVKQHQYILKNASELRKILSTPMLGQLLASGMLICFAGYQVTATVTVSTAKFLMSLLYLAYNLFGFYLVCRWCDEIKIKSEDIRDAIYFSGWERGMAAMPGVRARLMLVAARASRPLVLTAGGLYDLSLMSYTNLVKTSYSALTVLLRVRH